MTKQIETTLTIPVEGGSMGGFLAMPAGGVGPGIIMLQEIFGVNDAMKDKARAFAKEGFIVLVPDLFWRQEPGVALGYDEAGRTKGFGFLQNFDFPKGIADIAAAFTTLKADKRCHGSPSFVGFCLGGKLAVLAGATVPDARAVVSFYGVKLDQNVAQLETMICPTMLHFGTDDAHIPNDVSRGLLETFNESENVTVNIYDGAQHGFFNQQRPECFAPDAAALAMRRTLEHLRAA